MNKKILIVSILILLLIIILGTSIGSYSISPDKIINVLLYKLLNIKLPENITQNDINIIWMLRFPRVLLAVLVGASLGVSGSCVQSVLKNSLASPYTLGVSSGASFGAALVIITKLSIPYLKNFTLTSVGFVCGLITVIIIIGISERIDHSLSNQTIILMGMIISLLINALLTIIIALAHQETRQIILWHMGSLALKSWSSIIALLPFFFVGIIGILYYTNELDALTFGEENALTLGVDVKKVKRMLIIFSCILAGSAIAITGTIGFLGLVAPHIVRKLFGAKHKMVIPISAIFGAAFLIITDLIARTIISPSELPVGAITALIGAPFFAAVYFSKGSR